MFTTARYRVYVESTVALARSLVIKHEGTNQLINAYLSQAGVYVDPDPSKWKYYMNLAGEYHSRDTPMTVLSSDTQAIISFDKATLVNHPRTLVDYRRGGVFYKDLVARFPKQELLINGITHPIPVQKIIDARDFTILGWDTNLVEENETSLITRLQSWVDNYVARWYNPDFALTDPLYPAAFYAIMVMHIPNAIINIRNETAWSAQAHSFHVWSYLAGHYQLDRYKGYLTNQQVMWLYRNIRGVRRNAGKRSTFNDLVENILVPRGVRLRQTDMLATDADLISNGRPRVSFTHTEYGKAQVDLSTAGLVDTRQVLTETENVAPENSRFLEYDYTDLRQKTVASPYTRIPTGLFRADESAAVAVAAISDVQIRTDSWVQLSALGLFNPLVTISIPNNPDRSMSWRDALILFIYATNKSAGVETEFIPSLTIPWAPAMTPPDFTAVRALVPAEVTDDIIHEIIDNCVTPAALNDLGEWEAYVEKLVTQIQRQTFIWEGAPTAMERSYRRDVAHSCYRRTTVTLAAPNAPYNDWFSTLGFDRFTLSDRDWYDLAMDILKKTIAFEAVKRGLAPTQANMVEIVDRLSSYGLIFVSGDGSTRLQTIEFPNLLPGESTVGLGQTNYVEVGLSIDDYSSTDSAHTQSEELEVGGLRGEDLGIHIQENEVPIGTALETTMDYVQTTEINNQSLFFENIIINLL